ncbi:Uncharacterised protein [Streptococcus pneumoniae]|nr:Uncharacterised protein [Streptococcus pneumoniae]
MDEIPSEPPKGRDIFHAAISNVANWEYTIYAKNLPKPITGELRIEVV